MKAAVSILAVILAVLLAACVPAVPAETTTAPTEVTTTAPTAAPTTAPTTEPTTEATTEATEPEPQILEPARWMTDPVYPSYEEFLAKEPEYAPVNASSWLVMDGDSGIEYRLGYEGLKILSSVQGVAYPVPNVEALQDYYARATDGRYVYMLGDTELIKVELQTGEILDSIQLERIMVSTIVDDFVMYCITYDGAQFNACRVYLPEMKLDVLNGFDAPEKLYVETGTHYIDGSLRFILLNPELIALLERELQNPESPYRKPVIYGHEADFSQLWTTEKFWDEQFLMWQDMFLFGVQEMSGIRAFVEYHYHLEDNTLTTRTGIIDGCSFGTGDPHDHFKPEITEIDGPVAVNGPWQPIPGLDIQGAMTEKPAGEFTVEQRSFGTGPAKLYLCRGGRFTELAELSLQNMTELADGICGITQDNRIVKLSYDGKVCNTLYAGSGPLQDIIYLENGFYVVDGDRLVEIDLSTGQSRVLVQQEYMWDIEFWNKEEGTIYFLASEGLTHQQHTYDPAAGTLERVSVMW